MRKKVTFKLDVRLIEALNQVADLENSSTNKFLEKILLDMGIKYNILPSDTQMLPETRGGNRRGKKID